MSIRKRLTIWYGGAFTAIIVILSIVITTVSYFSVLRTMDDVLEQNSDRLLEDIRILPVGEFGALEREVVLRDADWFDVPSFTIQLWQTHEQGEEIAPFIIRSSNTLQLTTPLIGTENTPTTEPAYAITWVNGERQRILARTLLDDNGIQIGIVQIGITIEPMLQTTEILLVITLVAGGISILVSVVISMWMADRVVQPIERVAATASQVAVADDLSKRLTWDGKDDEMGHLVKVFNHMMERLETLFSVQQRFVGDVSHELRTPLTSIIGNLEIIDRYGFDQDSFDAVHREAARMSRMVNDLLLLARADYGELTVELYPVDLDPIMLEVFEQLPLLAKGRDLKFDIRDIQPAHINGNSDRLKQLILNLTNNAIKFTPDGGRITVGLTTTLTHATLEVTDTGMGISEEDVKQIFERFFQADHSRAQRTETDGAGLGLSIVQWIVRIHDADIKVKSEVGKGTSFFVTIPLLKDTSSNKI